MVLANRSPIETLTLVRRVGWWTSSVLFGAVLVLLVVGTLALAGVDPAVLAGSPAGPPTAERATLLAALIVLSLLGTLVGVVASILDS